MPLYAYECSCGHVTEEMRRIDDRHEPGVCEECGGQTAFAILTPTALDNLNMGLDRDFPTAWDRWEKIQRSKNTGKQWDSNNRRYGGDWEKKK